MWGLVLGYLIGKNCGYGRSQQQGCDVVKNDCATLLKDYDRQNRLDLAAVNIRNEPSDLYERHEELYRQQDNSKTEE